jgi:hypothetical protein
MFGNGRVNLSGDAFAGGFEFQANTMTDNGQDTSAGRGQGIRCVSGTSLFVAVAQDFGTLGTNKGGDDSFIGGSCLLFDPTNDPIIP